MDVIKLPAGQRAEDEADCIAIEELPTGKHRLTGSALLNCGDGDNVELVALIGGDTYASYEEAEAAGIAWASDHCVDVLYIGRSNGVTPLPDIGDGPEAG